MDVKQPASQPAEESALATWGCLLFFVLFLVFIGALALLAGGSN